MKWLLAALVALVLVLSGVGYGLYERNQRLGDQNKILTEASNRAAERELEYRRILGSRSKEIASQARKLKQAQQGLSEALQANKSWSDTDVPTDIQKALSGPSDGPADRL